MKGKCDKVNHLARTYTQRIVCAARQRHVKEMAEKKRESEIHFSERIPSANGGTVTDDDDDQRRDTKQGF